MRDLSLCFGRLFSIGISRIILSVAEIIRDFSGMQKRLFCDFDSRRDNREEGWEAVLESKVVGIKDWERLLCRGWSKRKTNWKGRLCYSLWGDRELSQEP